MNSTNPLGKNVLWHLGHSPVYNIAADMCWNMPVWSVGEPCCDVKSCRHMVSNVWIRLSKGSKKSIVIHFLLKRAEYISNM